MAKLLNDFKPAKIIEANPFFYMTFCKMIDFLNDALKIPIAMLI